MKIIGIHDGHNSSACYVYNGNVVNLIQEERLVNEKNYFGFPEKSLKKILETNNINLSDIDYFAFNGYHIPFPTDKKALLEIYSKSYDFKNKLKSVIKNNTPIYSQYVKKRKSTRMEYLVNNGVNKDKIKFIEHHLCHASTAYFGANWIDKNKDVLILTQDGSGDGLSATVNIGNNSEIKRIASIKKDDSLGRIYATVTFMLGMIPLEHEYKLMGMAPYSPEDGALKSYKVFKELLKFSKKDNLIWKRKKGLPAMQHIYPYLRDNLELHRFDWICAGLQKFTEELLVEWVQNAIDKTGIKDVVLSGGTFMNVKANQKISELEDVNNIFVFPSCGDESNSLGAAWNVYYSKHKNSDIIGLKHLYLGDDPTDKSSCLNSINKFSKKSNLHIKFDYFEDIEAKVAELLSDGQIVARCKGPVEFGARALGNRSILCNPSDLNLITEINNMIKKRDFWMPFAPVMLKERSNEYIENKKNIDAPYMIMTFNSTNKYKEFIGGVQQIDLTARPQIVDGSRNPDYYKLLKKYEQLTGSGVLINTSFNLHGLPIVYGPDEALFVLENSGLKYLALGNYLIIKD